MHGWMDDMRSATSVVLCAHSGFFILLNRLVGCFGLNGPLRQYFSLYRAVSQREAKKEKRNDR